MNYHYHQKNDTTTTDSIQDQRKSKQETHQKNEILDLNFHSHQTNQTQHSSTSLCPSLPPIQNSTSYPLDSLLLEIEETMRQTDASRTPSPNLFDPKQKNPTNTSSISFPVAQRLPPPLPPKIPNRPFQRKISMPVFSSSRSHQSINPKSESVSRIPNLPSLPRVPNSHNTEPIQQHSHHPNHDSNQPPPLPPRHPVSNAHQSSSARSRSESIPEPSSSSSNPRRANQSSSLSSSNSPLNFFRRPLPNPRPSQSTHTHSSHTHSSSDAHTIHAFPPASSLQPNNSGQYIEQLSYSPTTPISATSRPLPHLPHSYHPNPTNHAASTSSQSPNRASHDLQSPTNSLHSSHSPQYQSKRAPIIGPKVTYTNKSYDYDSPLGPHSIPTRIGTRPIHFTSPDCTEDFPNLDEAGYIAVDHSSHEDVDNQVKTINVADREMFLNGPKLTAEGENEERNNLQSLLHIYTTRPSTELSRPEDQQDLNSRKLRDSAPGDASQHHSGGLSVDRTPRLVSHSTSGFRSEALSRSSQLNLDPNFNIALMSHVGKFLKDNVPKGTKIKGSIEYPLAFTGREAVSTITHCLNRINPSTKSTTQATLNRKLALSLSRKLLSELFFHEVNNLNREIILNDKIDEVYMFPDDEMPNNQSGRENSFPQGVLTNLTRCYSFGCKSIGIGSSSEGIGACYSYDCPMRKNRDSVLGRTTSLMANNLVSDTPAPTTVVQTQDWASVVPKELLPTLDSKEIARQSIIYEIISGEQDYVQDLDDFEKLFIDPIKTIPIIPPPRVQSFLEKVVSNVLVIRDRNRVLLQNLIARQQDQHPLVKGIGDLILNSALEWGNDYIRYTNDHVFGEVEVNEEKKHNPLLANLLNQIPKQSSRRADFKHYHLRASVRLQRYILLLDNLLRKTPEGHEDRSNIETAIEVIKRQCKDANLSVELQQAKLNLVRLNKEIVTKQDTPDLQLLSPNRQLVYSGKVVRKPEGSTGLSEWTELNVMLFDHYFLMTKMKKVDDTNVRYQIWRQPIMLELLRVSGFNEPYERKSRGLRNITGTLGGGGGGSSQGLERGNSDPTGNHQVNYASMNSNQDDRTLLFPFTIHSLGRQSYSVVFYLESERLRQSWKAKFEEAIGMRNQILETFKVFDLHPMTDQTFAAAHHSGSNSNSLTGPNQNGSGSGSGTSTNGGHASGSSVNASSNNMSVSGSELASNMHGPPTCSVPFKSSDGKQLVAIGCNDGLWIGLRSDPSSVRQVIHIRSITQCAVLQEFGFLLVLAEKILLAYPLESLVPSRNTLSQAKKNETNNGGGTGGSGSGNGTIASRLSGNKDVLFFRCGKVGPRTLVIYVKKGGVNQTVFKALEPVKNTDKPKTTTSRGFFGIGGQKSESFRGYKEFFVPSESYAIQYLRSTLAIHCARGFEIMNLDTLKTASIPDFHQIRQIDPRLVQLQRRCDESRPLGMFRLGENEFLLCYDEFAFFADKHGDPLIDKYDRIMNWDGKPISVAYSSPYVIGFSPTLVEVWNTLTSRRVQLILGNGMNCSYDGGSLGDDGTVHVVGAPAGGGGHGSGGNVAEVDEGERRIHLVIKDLDGFFRVFEMVPLRI
ncbi:CNH domain-containing protein [Melampsora americana]|nr:CNH domain-containing protein [Melampsora americana]